MLLSNNIDFIEYTIKRFWARCCGHLSPTRLLEF